MAVVWKQLAFSDDAPTAHKTSHQNGGGDEVSVAGLNGLLADDQHVLDAEVTAVAVARSLFDAQTILTAVSDNTPVALVVAASRILGRKSTGNIAAMTAAEVRTIIGVESGATADQTGAEIVTLLEALVGAAQLSHTKISDIGATDHHTAAILNSLLTTRGDIIFRNASVPTRLAKGSAGKVLTMGANDPAWSDPTGGDIGEGHISIIPINYNSIGQGTWALALSATKLLAATWYNSTDANGDNISYKVYLAAGTYTLRLIYSLSPLAGIVDIDIDAAEVASVDMYSSELPTNEVFTQTSISIASSGLKTLKMRADGKNGSSSAYRINFNLITLWRTA